MKCVTLCLNIFEFVLLETVNLSFDFAIVVRRVHVSRLWMLHLRLVNKQHCYTVNRANKTVILSNLLHETTNQLKVLYIFSN